MQWKTFSEIENQTWTTLFRNLDNSRKNAAVPEFAEGIKKLGIDDSAIPSLEKINTNLMRETGWKGLPVEGLEEGYRFFPMLAQKIYPIGNFIRDAKDLSYTPAPDVFHDLYGHIPFMANKDYATFCEEVGKRASKYQGNEKALEIWGRFFWFTIEFALIETPVGRRIFGAGILSSYNECIYSLSNEPTVKPFNLEDIVKQEYRADKMQDILFVLPNRQALYHCLDDFEKILKN